jgi:hypothetical protein
VTPKVASSLLVTKIEGSALEEHGNVTDLQLVAVYGMNPSEVFALFPKLEARGLREGDDFWGEDFYSAMNDIYFRGKHRIESPPWLAVELEQITGKNSFRLKRRDL